MYHRYYCATPDGDHLVPLPAADEHQDIVDLKRRINSGEAPAYCPTSAGGCGRTMILAYNEEKRGKGNVRHLRHRVETNQCGLTRDMETHRRIQELMREHFTAQGHRVTLERYNPENRSRADVFISGGSLRGMTVSLEVQLSGMDRPFDLRDARYREGASTVEWLFARNTRERRHIADDAGHALSVHLKDDQVNLGIVHHLTRDSDPVPLSEWWVTPRGLVCAELVEVQHQEALREEHRDVPQLLDQHRSQVPSDEGVLRDYWRRASHLYGSRQFAAFRSLPLPCDPSLIGALTLNQYTSELQLRRGIAEAVTRGLGWPPRMGEVTPAISSALDMVQSPDPEQRRRGREWITQHLHPEDAHDLLERIRPRPGNRPDPCPRCGLAVDALANRHAAGYHHECATRSLPDPTLF